MNKKKPFIILGVILAIIAGLGINEYLKLKNCRELSEKLYHNYFSDRNDIEAYVAVAEKLEKHYPKEALLLKGKKYSDTAFAGSRNDMPEQEILEYYRKAYDCYSKAEDFLYTEPTVLKEKWVTDLEEMVAFDLVRLSPATKSSEVKEQYRTMILEKIQILGVSAFERIGKDFSRKKLLELYKELVS